MDGWSHYIDDKNAICTCGAEKVLQNIDPGNAPALVEVAQNTFGGCEGCAAIWGPCCGCQREANRVEGA